MSKKVKKTEKAKKAPSFPRWIILGVVVVLLGVIGVRALQPQPQTASGALENDGLPREVSVAQAANLRSNGAFMLDVREQSEWNELHVPDSTLIPLGTLPQRMNEVPKDQEVVIICRSGNRSAQARDLLLQAGYENVTSVAGGIREWQAGGFPTVSGP
jgi:rhodanese-related sulfurtransferase